MMGRIGAKHATGLSCEFKPNTCPNAPRPDRKTPARSRSARQVKRARVPCSISSQRARSALSQLSCSSRIQLTFITVRSIDSAERQYGGGHQQQVRVAQVEKAGAYTPHGPCPDKGPGPEGSGSAHCPISRCVDQNGPPGITPRVGSNSSNNLLGAFWAARFVKACQNVANSCLQAQRKIAHRGQLRWSCIGSCLVPCTECFIGSPHQRAAESMGVSQGRAPWRP